MIWLLNNWRALSGALLAVVFLLFVWSWHSRGENLAEEKALSKNLEETLRDERAWHKGTVKAIEGKVTHEKDRSKFRAEVARELAGAVDAPVAPVLSDAVERLRERQTKATK